MEGWGSNFGAVNVHLFACGNSEGRAIKMGNYEMAGGLGSECGLVYNGEAERLNAINDTTAAEPASDGREIQCRWRRFASGR